MSFFSWLKASPKAVDNVLDKDNGLLAQVGGWIGNASFTEEEQAEMNERMVKGVSGFVEMTLSENTERSKSRRAVAIMWIKAELLMLGVTFVVAPFDMVLAKFYLSIAFSTIMVAGTLSVLGFFFGAHMLSSHLGFNKNKASK